MVSHGVLDAASLSTSNLVDEIILAMLNCGVVECLNDGIPDRRADNAVIPFDLVWVSAIAAKMKLKMSLSDVPFAITDHRVLAELGYALYDMDGISNGMMQEGSLRHLIGKYSWEELLCAYTETVQEQIMPYLGLSSNIHILDCTPLEVNLDNQNHEMSGIGRDKKGWTTRGYSLATLRGVVKDKRYRNYRGQLLRATDIFHEGDILINDRGFLSRDMMNYMKTERGVDTYVPLRKDMLAYKYAVREAMNARQWLDHPNKKRTRQKIALVSDMGCYWQSHRPKDDVEINTCVVWDIDRHDYFVFATTDLAKSAKDIVKIYELRPEIEEDFRQLKDFWCLEDFKSTKINAVCFHIASVLFGYLFFQLYTMLPEGEAFMGKSLPVVLKNYISKALGFVILYVGSFFGILTIVELMRLYAKCGDAIRPKLEEVLGAV